MGLLLLQRAIFVKELVAQATEADDSMKEVLDYCCQRIRLKRKTVLRVSANATSPAVCGLFRPVVLLPHNLSQSLSAGQLQSVLLHELAHIKRGDLWVNLVQTVLQILYFYNPLLWIANLIIRRIREQAVDEMVLVAMGEKAQQYPQTLVSVAKLAFKRPVLSLRLIGVVESKSALAGRIKRILSRPLPKTTKLGIFGLLSLIVIAAILLPMAKAQKQAGQMTDVQVGNLQSLIDAAKPGDTVTVPRGLYTEPVEINKSLTIKGESRNECIFEVTANKPAIFVDTKGKGQIVVQDLTIKWQLATSDKGIERPFALGVKDTQAEIKNCSFIPLGNFQRSPVAVRADGLTQLNISKCRFEGFEYVICYGEGTKGKTSDCLIMNCGHQGIINYTGSTLTVERNVITGSKFHAVRCTGGTLYVKDNLLINNDNRGIYLGNRSGSGTITNNLIIGNGTGIGCFARSKYEIKNNIIADSSYAGIGMEKSCLLTIQDNIFVHNERGWIMFDRGEKGANTCDRNTFWQNKADDENFEKSANSINANPDFVDPNNGDFSLRPGPALEHKQGLTNPQIFKELWKIWKKRENRNETAVQVEVEQKKEKREQLQEQPVIRAGDNKATLSSGLTVELLGVTRVPVQDQPWWKPDRSPLEPMFEWAGFDPSLDPDWEQFDYYAVVMRLTDMPSNKIGWMDWRFSDANGYPISADFYPSPERVSNKYMVAKAARFSKDLETTTLRIGIVSGEWQTLFAGSHYGIYEKGGDSVYVSTPEIGGGPGLVGPSEEGIHIGVTYNITDRDFRVVAVDKEGKVYVSSRSGSGGGKNLRRTTASFPDLTREQLQEYRFQVRPYEWMEFKDIPLRPGSEAVALAEQRKARRQEELEKWLGEGQTCQIRQQIAVLRDTYDIHEPDNSQVSGILAMQGLVRIGSPAVPELVAELRRCERRLTKSLIAFTLRTIGDRQVVPALIELLGQSKYSGELGIYVKDDRLANFMLDNQYRPSDEGDRKAKAVIIGCPVMEITAALEKITGHSEGHEHFGHKATAELGPDAPHEQWQQRVQQIVQETADRWQKWWDGHKEEFISR